MKHGRKIAVIGLGYVGLPVAVSFARAGVPVVGFDIDAMRVAELRQGTDRTREVDVDEWRKTCEGLPLEHMGRGPDDDPWFFASAFAAGKVARTLVG